MIIRRFIVETVSFTFVLLFVYAAINKLMDVEKFKVQVGLSPLLTAISDLIVFGIPLLELVIAFILCFPKLRFVGLFCAFSLMTMFTAYIIAILKFSDFVPCSCGGILENLGWREHLVFNIALVVLAVAGIFALESTKDRLNLAQESNPDKS